MLKASKIVFIFSALVLLLAACGETSPAPTPAALPAATLTPTPVAAPTPTPNPVVEERTPAPASTNTPTPTITPTFTPIPAPTPVPPSASFSVDLESGSAPLVVDFDNTSQGSATSYEWDFGDGTTSTDESPSHRYTIAGTYDVRLTVSGRGGEDTSIMTDLITVSPGEAASLEIAPPNMTLAVEEGTQFSAVARDEFGNIVPADVEWDVSGEEGTITDSGLFTAETIAGTFDDLVMASLQTDSGEITASANLIVKPGLLANVSIEPAEVSLDIGATQSFAFAALDDFDNEIEDAILSWSVSPEFGEIDSDGLLTAGTTAGEFPAVVRLEVVKDGDRVSAAADLTIRPDPLDAIEVEPSFAVVEKGESQQFTASGFDEFANEITDVEFTWSAKGGEITSDGTFTAGDESGSYEVSVEATFKDSTKNAAATVPVPPVWVPTGRLVIERSSHASVLLPDGKVLIVGDTDVAELYDSVTGAFSSIGTMPCNHEREAKATVLADGRVLVTGGRFDLRCANIYDPETGAFKRVGDMNADHFGHTSTLLRDGRVLISGGDREDENGDYVSHTTAEIFDPKTETFTLTGSLNKDRRQHDAVLLPDGQVLIVAGLTGNVYGGDFDCLSSVEIYDPFTGSFETIGNLRFNGCDVVITSLDDGNVLIIRTRKAEIYDYRAGRFRGVGNMSVERGRPTVTLLSDGKVLIVGGFGGVGSHGSAEIYDPATEAFSSADSPTDPRDAHAATLLPNGWVLMTGGFVDGKHLNSAEFYIPSNLSDGN